MSAATNRAQVKVSVDAGVAAAFKKACADSGVSMAAVIGRFMADYADAPVGRKAEPDYSSRRRRRTAVKVIIAQLEQMRGWEEKVRDRMPENLQGSAAYDAAEEAVSSLEEAADALAGFWVAP